MSETQLSPEERIVRRLLWILRHDDSQSIVQLDQQGWAALPALASAVSGLSAQWLCLTKDDLKNLIASQPPGRLEVEGDQVRACYGHSLSGMHVAPRAIPPSFLFHATREECLTTILLHGLEPRGRNFVHLTSDIQYARQLAMRTTTGRILAIDTAVAIQAGTPFFHAGTHVWQAPQIDPQFLSVTGEGHHA